MEDDHRRLWRRGPFRLPGPGDQRGIFSAIARPGCRSRRSGIDIDPRRGYEPGTDAALGFDRGGQPSDRIDTRVPWPYFRPACARARHLAPLSHGGGAERSSGSSIAAGSGFAVAGYFQSVTDLNQRACGGCDWELRFQFRVVPTVKLIGDFAWIRPPFLSLSSF